MGTSTSSGKFTKRVSPPVSDCTMMSISSKSPPLIPLLIKNDKVEELVNPVELVNMKPVDGGQKASIEVPLTAKSSAAKFRLFLFFGG